MKVRATQLGYYEHKRRYEGDVFEIKDEPTRRVTIDGEVVIRPAAFSDRWMEVSEDEDVGEAPRVVVPARHLEEPEEEEKPKKSKTKRKTRKKKSDEVI